MKRIYIQNNTLEKNLLGLLVCALLFLAGAYAYFINQTVLHAITRNSSLRNAAELQGQVAKLETRAFQTYALITQEEASRRGFVILPRVAFNGF